MVAIIAEREDMELGRLGCYVNNIYLQGSAHQNIAPGQKLCRGPRASQAGIFSTKTDLEKELWDGDFWPNSYDVWIVDEGENWKVVERYLQ